MDGRTRCLCLVACTRMTSGRSANERVLSTIVQQAEVVLSTISMVYLSMTMVMSLLKTSGRTMSGLPPKLPQLQLQWLQVRQCPATSRTTCSNHAQPYCVLATAALAAALPGTAPPAQPREACQYGPACYRTNTMHRAQFSHPGDIDWSGTTPDGASEPAAMQDVHAVPLANAVPGTGVSMLASGEVTTSQPTAATLSAASPGTAAHTTAPLAAVVTAAPLTAATLAAASPGTARDAPPEWARWIMERMELLTPHHSAPKRTNSATTVKASKIPAAQVSSTSNAATPTSAEQHLSEPSSGPHELFARVSDWARQHGGGRAVKIASGPSDTSMVLRCQCNDCPFTVKCRAKRGGSWSINFGKSVWTHGGPTWHCSSRQHVDVHVCSQLPSVKAVVLRKPTVGALGDNV